MIQTHILTPAQQEFVRSYLEERAIADKALTRYLKTLKEMFPEATGIALRDETTVVVSYPEPTAAPQSESQEPHLPSAL